MPPARQLDWTRDGADWPNREASRFLRAGGLRWHVQRMGAGPTVLLIHGSGGASHSWRDVAPLLAQDFDVIVPDLPGHGFSSRGRRSALTLPAVAAALGELLRALEAAPALLVGHSAGAAIAAEMALEGHARPCAIVAFNGAILPFPGLAGQIFPSLAKLLALNPLVPRALAWGADRRAVDALMEQGGREIDATGRALYRRLLASPGHVEAALQMLAVWDLPPLVRRLPRLGCRLELVYGEEDRAVPPSVAAEVAARAPHARLSPLPGLGHLAHEQRPDLAAEAVRRIAAETVNPGAQSGCVDSPDQPIVNSC
jgi:magnesium chelatase accessory protein